MPVAVNKSRPKPSGDGAKQIYETVTIVMNMAGARVMR